MRGRMEARMRAICVHVGLELRRWMRQVKAVARRRALSRDVVWCSAGLPRQQHGSRAHGAQFTNAHMRGMR